MSKIKINIPAISNCDKLAAKSSSTITMYSSATRSIHYKIDHRILSRADINKRLNDVEEALLKLEQFLPDVRGVVNNGARQYRFTEDSLLHHCKSLSAIKSTGFITQSNRNAFKEAFNEFFNKLQNLWTAITEQLLAIDQFIKALPFPRNITIDTFKLYISSFFKGTIRIPFITEFFGFAYNYKEGYFYTVENSIQSFGGFMDLYDGISPWLGMDLETEIFTFISGDREYRIQLWEGTYGWGGMYGSEIGIYYRSAESAQKNPYIKGDPNSALIWYQCAKEGDQLPMRMTLYDKNDMSTPLVSNDTRDYAENGDHFWNLATTKNNNNYTKNDLVILCELEITDSVLRNDFIQSLQENNSIYLLEGDDNTVVFLWEA